MIYFLRVFFPNLQNCLQIYCGGYFPIIQKYRTVYILGCFVSLQICLCIYWGVFPVLKNARGYIEVLNQSQSPNVSETGGV